jgi:hypothetical protein
MATPRRKIDGRLIRQRCCAVVALLSYLVVTVGVPVPAASTRKGGSPFACQTRSCGCQTDMDCQSGCCCGAQVETQAAPRENDDIPRPDEDPAAEPASCPRCGAKKQCDNPASLPKSCCAAKHEQARSCFVAPGKSKSTFRWFVGLKALECQGASTLWITTGAVVLPPVHIALETSLPVVDRVWPSEFLCVSRSTPPLLRPPR